MPEARWDPSSLLDPRSARHAGRDLLSLQLIDARNVTLAWLDCFESAQCLTGASEVDPLPLRDIGRAG